MWRGNKIPLAPGGVLPETVTATIVPGLDFRERGMTAAEKYAREREWADTDIGRLFIRFESAMGRAWVTDCRENASTAAMTRDWDAANKARSEFLTALRGW